MANPPTKKPDGETQPDSNGFAAEIAKRVSAVVGRDKASVVAAQVVALFSERFSGPIAHPKHLREYEEILPGSADRIISMAERSLEHNQKMDEKALQAEINDVREGRLYGFCALLALIGGALICGLYGHTTLAAAFLGTGVVGTIGIFIKGKLEKSD